MIILLVVIGDGKDILPIKLGFSLSLTLFVLPD
jgi:hypothetical protein